MGKGLSKLQQFILSEAFNLGRCYYADVLEKYYRWEPIRSIERYDNTCADATSALSELKVSSSGLVGQIRYPSRKYFSPKKIGLKEYRKVMATLCRSCARLRDRGLVHCWQGNGENWACVELTDRGREWIEGYLARQKFLEDAARARLQVIITRRRIRVRPNQGGLDETKGHIG
jgi:hypothetical protein